jgi:hypothetical protein
MARPDVKDGDIQRAVESRVDLQIRDHEPLSGKRRPGADLTEHMLRDRETLFSV